MFAGHFGVAAAAKSKAPKVPLWALMLSTQLLDVVFIPLLLSGIETIQPIGGGGYGRFIIHAHYTHSLVGALIISGLWGLFALLRWGRNGGLVVSSVTFSHWILDFIVHRGDLPLIPGGSESGIHFGLGLWGIPVGSMALEALLILGGLAVYHRSLPETGSKARRMIASGTLGALLILALVSDVAGIG